MKEMIISKENIVGRSWIYALVLLVLPLLAIYGIIFGHMDFNSGTILGIFAVLVLSALAFWDAPKVFLGIIFFLPFLIGADKFQINIGSYVRSFFPVGDIYVNSFSLSCLFIVIAASVEFFRRNFHILGMPLFRVIVLTLVFAGLSFGFSDYKNVGLVFALYLLAIFSAYLLGFLFLGSLKKFFSLMAVMIFSSIVPLTFGFYQLIAGDYIFEGDSTLGRIRGTFPHSNTFGSYLYVIIVVFLVVFLAVKALSRKGKSVPGELYKFRSAGGVFFLGLVLALVLTYSRTAWAGLVMSAAILAYYARGLRFPVFYFGTLAVFLAMIFEKTRERITGVLDRHMFDSLYGRMETWDMARFASLKKPLLGYGIGSFEDVIRGVQGKETGNVYPHNDSVRIFLEGGLLGFLSFVFYMLGAIFWSWKSFSKCPKGTQEVEIFGRIFLLEAKTLGILPLLLFVPMAVIGLVEAPSMDFVYQIFSWTILGSWLGASREYKG